MKVTSGPTMYVLYDGRRTMVFYSLADAERYQELYDIAGVILPSDSFKKVRK